MHPGTLKRQLKSCTRTQPGVTRESHDSFAAREIADQDPHGRVERDQSNAGHLHCFKSGTRVVHVIWRSVRQSVCGAGWHRMLGPRANFGGAFMVVDRESSQVDRRFMIFDFFW